MTRLYPAFSAVDPGRFSDRTPGAIWGCDGGAEVPKLALEAVGFSCGVVASD